jgi:hypothetical protein
MKKNGETQGTGSFHQAKSWHMCHASVWGIWRLDYCAAEIQALPGSLLNLINYKFREPGHRNAISGTNYGHNQSLWCTTLWARKVPLGQFHVCNSSLHVPLNAWNLHSKNSPTIFCQIRKRTTGDRCPKRFFSKFLFQNSKFFQKFPIFSDYFSFEVDFETRKNVDGLDETGKWLIVLMRFSNIDDQHADICDAFSTQNIISSPRQIHARPPRKGASIHIFPASHKHKHNHTTTHTHWQYCVGIPIHRAWHELCVTGIHGEAAAWPRKNRWWPC